MSVYVDRVFGYAIDVLPEYLKQDDKFRDKYEFGEDLPQSVLDLNFVSYYGSKNPQEGNVTLFHDGMCGEYARLVLLETYIRSGSDYETDDKLNVALRSCPVDTIARDKLLKVYEIMFSVEAKAEDVYMIDFAHFH